MRFALFTTLMLSAVGCQQSEISMSHMSTMDSQTRGVVLYDDGQRGHAAMWDTTCEFDTLNGWLISDHDLPTDDEVIQDTYNGIVLGRSDEGVHIVQDRDSDVSQHGVVASRLLEHGFATLHYQRATDSCAVDFDRKTVAVPLAACDDDAAVDSDRKGRLLIGTSDGTLSVSEDGVDEIGSSADIVIYDRATGLTYTAQYGGTEVTALDEYGDIKWTYETDGEITSMDDMGRRGMVMVMTGVPGSTQGKIIILEGISGEVVTDHGTPSNDVDITVSEDGTTMAAVLKDQVYFYDVTDTDDEPKVRKTLGSRQPEFTD